MKRLYFSKDGITDKNPFEATVVRCKHCEAYLTVDGNCSALCRCQHFPDTEYDGGFTSFCCKICFCAVDVESWRKQNLERYAEAPPLAA